MSQKFYKQYLGKLGETLALNYYLSKGYTLLSQNFYCRYGEIDLILEKDKKVLIVEVKTRSQKKYGWPEEAITEQKIKHLVRTSFIAQQKLHLPKRLYFEACIIFIKDKKAQLRRYSLQ